MSIIPDFNQAKIDAIAADMSPVYCKLSETTLQLCLHLLTRQPESESFWTLAGDDFNDVLRDYVYLGQKELIDAMNPVAKDIIFVPYKDVTEVTVQDAIEQLEDIKEDVGAAAAVAGGLADHEALTNNPHGVTASQIGVESGATADQTANEILTAIKTVDGTGSGLDADMVDGAELAVLVQTTGNQTVAGIKTFSSFPVTPSSAPAADYQAANKKYVDDNFEKIGVGVSVYNTSPINVSTGVQTTLTFNSERWDDAGFFSTAASTSRLTVPTGYDGWYIINGNARLSGSSAGDFRQIKIMINGTDIAQHMSYRASSASMNMSISTIYYLSAGQYAEFSVLQNSGVTMTVDVNSNTSPEFRMVRIG